MTREEQQRISDKLGAEMAGACAGTTARFYENKIKTLESRVKKLTEALEKIADPRKRDHIEPDKYTEVGCMIHIAEQALED